MLQRQTTKKYVLFIILLLIALIASWCTSVDTVTLPQQGDQQHIPTTQEQQTDEEQELDQQGIDTDFSWLVLDETIVLAAVQDQDWLRWYIDLDGNWVIAPQFTQAWSFSHGLAVVTNDSNALWAPLWSGQEYYWIDIEGNTLYQTPWSDDLFYFYNDHSFVFNLFEQQFYRIFRDWTVESVWFDWVIQWFQWPDYVFQWERSWFIDAAWNRLNDDQWDDIAPFNEDFALTLKDWNIRHINQQWEYLYQEVWSTADQFVEWLAWVEQDGVRWFIDTTWAVVIPLQFEDVGQFYEGFASIKQDGLRWFIDTTGTIRIVPQFEFVGRFSDGLAVVYDWTAVWYINTDGERVIEPQFELAFDFAYNRASFSSWSLFGFIDMEGEVVIEPQFLNALNFVESTAFNQMQGGQ